MTTSGARLNFPHNIVALFKQEILTSFGIFHGVFSTIYLHGSIPFSGGARSGQIGPDPTGSGTAALLAIKTPKGQQRR